MTTFGDNIRQAREAAGISVNRMGEILGVGRSNLISMEKNRRPMPEPVMEKLAQELGIHVDMLHIWKLVDAEGEEKVLAAAKYINSKRGKK